MNGMNAMSATKDKKTRTTGTVKLLSARGLTVMALLSAMASVLMLFEIPLWFTPDFYKLDFGEVPVLIGAFTLGPVAGIIIEMLKIALNFFLDGSYTAGIGELANLILGCSLVVPSAIIYHISKSKKTAVIGMIVGTITFVIAGCILNAYLLLPTYSKMFMPMETIIGAGTKVNKNITDLKSFIFLAVAPFNLIKGGAVTIITSLLYKYVSPIIKGYHKDE